MKLRESIRHIMTPNPIVLRLNDGLTKAEVLFKKHKVRHLPVVSDNEIKGILSMTDLARISFVDSFNPETFSIDNSVYSLFSLEQIMVRNPECIPPTTTIKEAANFFFKKRIPRSAGSRQKKVSRNSNHYRYDSIFS